MAWSVAAACIAEVCIAEVCVAEACSDVEVEQAMVATPSTKAMRGVVLPPAIWEQGTTKSVGRGVTKCDVLRVEEVGLTRVAAKSVCVGVNGESRRGTGVGCKFGWVQDEIYFCIHKRSRFDRFGRCTHRLV